jgi:hypothetical protein
LRRDAIGGNRRRIKGPGERDTTVRSGRFFFSFANKENREEKVRAMAEVGRRERKEEGRIRGRGKRREQQRGQGFVIGRETGNGFGIGFGFGGRRRGGGRRG